MLDKEILRCGIQLRCSSRVLERSNRRSDNGLGLCSFELQVYCDIAAKDMCEMRVQFIRVVGTLTSSKETIKCVPASKNAYKIANGPDAYIVIASIRNPIPCC